jgi:hypothetical protein
MIAKAGARSITWQVMENPAVRYEYAGSVTAMAMRLRRSQDRRRFGQMANPAS